MIPDELNDFRVGVRNCTHLLAADSARVKEIKEDMLVFGSGAFQRRGLLFLPWNGICHSLPPFFELPLCLQR
jgi:hypothetical protein